MQDKPMRTTSPSRTAIAMAAASVCLAVALASCSPSRTEGPAGDSIVIEIDTLFTLGSMAATTTDDARLMSPWNGVVDSKGRIYVADKSKLRIQSYDSAGAYLGSVGSPGRGPGEFTTFAALTVTPDDDVLVFDGLNDRASTLNADRGFIESEPFQVDADFSTAWFGDSLFICQFRAQSQDENAGFVRASEPVSGNVMEVLSRPFVGVVSYRDLFDERRQTARLFMDMFADLLTPFSDGILLTPRLFAGSHYLLQKRGTEWQLTKTYSAPTWMESLTEFEGDQDAAADLVVQTGPDQTMLAQIHNQSRGTHVDEAGRLLHLVELERDGYAGPKMMQSMQAVDGPPERQGGDPLKRRPHRSLHQSA